MRLAQVLIYESDGKIAEGLRSFAAERGVRLRELRQEKACLGELRRTGAGLFILKLGRDLEREIALLQQTSLLFPDTPVVVVGDADYPGLAALAWDLGAYYVLFRQHPMEILCDIVDHLLPGPSGPAPP